MGMTSFGGYLLVWIGPRYDLARTARDSRLTTRGLSIHHSPRTPYPSPLTPHDLLLTAMLAACQAAVEWKMEEGTYRDDITAIVVYLKDLLPLL